MNDCLSIEDLLEQTDTSRAHVRVCADCQAAADDVGAIRELAARLPESGWAATPAVEVDVEAALANVLSGRPLALIRRRRAPFALRFASTLAAAAVLFSIAAPSLLRWRIDSQSTGSAPLELSGVQAHSIFWTTTGGR